MYRPEERIRYRERKGRSKRQRSSRGLIQNSIRRKLQSARSGIAYVEQRAAGEFLLNIHVPLAGIRNNVSTIVECDVLTEQGGRSERAAARPVQSLREWVPKERSRCDAAVQRCRHRGGR